MPVESDKTQIVVPEEVAGTAKPKQGKKKLLLFGGIGLGVVVIGVVLALFVLQPMMAGGGEGKADPNATKDKQAEKSGHAEKKPEPAKKKESGHGGGEAGNEGGAIVYTVKDMVINPAGTNGSRFLSVSFGLELANAETQAALEARDPLVRDALITIMSSKTVAQLTDAREKEITRLQIKKRLSDLLQTSDIAAVYFTDFVLQ
jgi:flagellar FliL protein